MRLIRLPEVVKKVGLCRATLYQMIAKNEFPAPIKVRSASVWVEEEVEAWIRALVTKART